MIDLNEMCWNTGDFRDGCDCMTCSHRYECKEIMKSYGVEFVGISKCKEYEKEGV